MPAGGVPRDPQAEVRTRRALEQLSAIIGSLKRSGILVPVGPGEWDIDPDAVIEGDPPRMAVPFPSSDGGDEHYPGLAVVPSATITTILSSVVILRVLAASKTLVANESYVVAGPFSVPDPFVLTIPDTAILLVL